jgi:membrane protein implicated in regulation of membrane protease activity
MDWSAPTLWWVLAGVLVAVELATGTFYLLMLAVGAVAAALAAHAGVDGTAQVAVAALLGGGATAAWHLKRARHPRSAPAASNRDVVLDIGETVDITAWQPDGSARVHYRGASWRVRYAGTGTPAPGHHRIVALHGSELSVDRA